jgi:hypothetical protein
VCLGDGAAYYESGSAVVGLLLRCRGAGEPRDAHSGHLALRRAAPMTLRIALVHGRADRRGRGDRGVAVRSRGGHRAHAPSRGGGTDHRWHAARADRLDVRTAVCAGVDTCLGDPERAGGAGVRPSGRGYRVGGRYRGPRGAQRAQGSAHGGDICRDSACRRGDIGLSAGVVRRLGARSVGPGAHLRRRRRDRRGSGR